MKKIFALVITMALVLSIAACSKAGTPGPSTTSPSPSMKTPTTSTTAPSTTSTSPSTSSQSPTTTTPTKTGMAGTLKDGTYSAKGDPWTNGQEEAVLTVKSGKLPMLILKTE